MKGRKEIHSDEKKVEERRRDEMQEKLTRVDKEREKIELYVKKTLNF